jgi:hypothetical protein
MVDMQSLARKGTVTGGRNVMSGAARKSGAGPLSTEHSLRWRQDRDICRHSAGVALIMFSAPCRPDRDCRRG